MELQTVVKLERPAFQVDYTTPVMMLGSCFVENIGEKLKYFRFPVDINPCGIVYNPFSVAETIYFLLHRKQFRADELWQNAGKWVSLSHHGCFSDRDVEECLRKINCRMENSSLFLRKTKVMVITWGTSWVYKHKSSGRIVVNCHKFPAGDFDHYRLGVSDVVSLYVNLLQELFAEMPELEVVFTVSPVRHWKDGAHGNQVSKAVLLLAIDELVRRFAQVSYFPSFEIVMDELRDYRFYAEDMLHLSAQGIHYIWERFRETYMTEQARDMMKQVDKLNKILLHRPLDAKDEASGLQKKEAIAALQQLGVSVEFPGI